MDSFVVAFNVAASAALAVLLGAAVMAPQIKDGIVIKLGLCVMSVALAAHALVLADGLSCQDVWRLNNARAALLFGALVAACGLAWRFWRGERRSLDYIERRSGA